MNNKAKTENVINIVKNYENYQIIWFVCMYIESKSR